MRHIVSLIVLLWAAQSAWGQPVQHGPFATSLGPVTVTQDPSMQNQATVGVQGAKDENGAVVGHDIETSVVSIAASTHGTATAYCAPAEQIRLCLPDGTDYIHYGPWYLFRNVTNNPRVGNWVTQEDPFDGWATPGPPRPDGPNGPGIGQHVNVVFPLGPGDSFFIDSPGINLPCPPGSNASTTDQTYTQKFTTYMYTGQPPRAYCSFKWGHTITYNETTKTTSIESCPVTSQMAGTAEFIECMNKVNVNALAADFDPVKPVESCVEYFVVLGPVTLDFPNNLGFTFSIQLDLEASWAERGRVLRGALRYIRRIAMGFLRDGP